MDIQTMIESGSAKIEEHNRQVRAESARREAEAEAQRIESLAKFKADVLAALPEALHPYIVIDDQLQPGWTEHVQVEIPNCTTISTVFNKHPNENRYVFREKYSVRYPQEVRFDYEENRQFIYYDWKGFSDVEIALAVASREYQREQQILAQIEADNAKVQEEAQYRREVDERRDADRAAEAEQKAIAEMEERSRLLDMLQGDQVALALARVFAAVQADRESWQSQLDAANEFAYEAEARYSRKLDDVRQEAESRRREAEDYRMRASDAEDEAEKLRRKMRQ